MICTAIVDRDWASNDTDSQLMQILGQHLHQLHHLTHNDNHKNNFSLKYLDALVELKMEGFCQDVNGRYYS